MSFGIIALLGLIFAFVFYYFIIKLIIAIIRYLNSHSK